MKISLLTTTRNRSHFLLEAALSVASQVYKPYQWIICVDDDYSKYADVLSKIIKFCPYVQILNSGEVGRVRSLLLAHQFVAGDYVGWLDDDDWLSPFCLDYCKDGKSDIIYTDFYEVKDNKAIISRRNQVPYSYQKLFEYNMLFHFKLFRQDLYTAVGGVDVNFDTTMDYELSLRMARHCTPEKIDKPLYYYRIHDNRITSNSHKRQKENYFKAIEKNR